MSTQIIRSGLSTRFQAQDFNPADISSRILRAFSRSDFSPRHATLLNTLTPLQLDQVLKSLFENLANQQEGINPEVLLNKLAEVLPLQQVQRAINPANPVDALTQAQNHLRQAKYYLEKTQPAFSPTLRTRLSSILDTLIGAIDTFLTIFGVADFCKPAVGDFQADFKFQRIMMMIGLFTLLTATLLPMLGVTTGASIVGGTMLLIAVLSLIWPKIRPASFKLPIGQNWTQLYQQGKLVIRNGRKDSVAAVAESLANKKAILLIGPSGVGKTQTMEGFTAALDRGNFPELGGKQVIYLSAADLINHKEALGSGNNIIKHIKTEIGENLDDFILVIDEIALLYQMEDGVVIGEQLKVELDRTFKLVVAMTTEEEYYRDIYSGNPAIDRRFKKEEIASTSPAETITILNDTLLQKAPQLVVDEDVMEYIWKLTSNSPQPLGAINLLEDCIEWILTTQKTPKEHELEEIQNQINLIDSQRSVRKARQVFERVPTLSNAAQDRKQTTPPPLDELVKKAATLSTEIEAEKAQRAQLFKTLNQLSQVTASYYRTVVKVSSMQANLTRDHALSAALLLSHYLAPALEDAFQELSKITGIQSVIKKSLVDQVNAKNEEKRAKAEKARARGKTTLYDRSNQDPVKV